MAHNARSLSRMASSAYGDNKSCSAFFYATEDAAAAVLTAGYFNDSRPQLTVGDQIFASVGLGGTLNALHLQVTAVPAAGNITVADRDDTGA